MQLPARPIKPDLARDKRPRSIANADARTLGRARAARSARNKTSMHAKQNLAGATPGLGKRNKWLLIPIACRLINTHHLAPATASEKFEPLSPNLRMRPIVLGIRLLVAGREEWRLGEHDVGTEGGGSGSFTGAGFDRFVQRVEGGARNGEDWGFVG